jgi:aspartyl-tRNA synthetase
MMRTHKCGELRKDHIGQRVTLCGWCNVRRDHGGLIFVDLRDRSGRVQTVFDPKEAAEVFETAHQVRSEFVLRIEGSVAARPAGTENANLPTGDIEVRADKIEVLNPSKPLPFQVDEDTHNVDETTRLKYRYLDLRTARMQRNMEVRHQFVTAIREHLNQQDFWEIETPMLLKSTPEGARDFLVPARLVPGHFFALPQSPQLMKQTLMISGIERYYQIARCLRDEDLRGDRQFEHTQIDIEMSFINEEDIYALIEGMMKKAFGACGIEIETPFPRLSYEESMARFGNDKPDLRYGMELQDVAEIVRGSEFRPVVQTLASEGIIKGLCAPGCAEMSRKEIDTLTSFVARFGAGGLIYLPVKDDALSGNMAKFFSAEQHQALKKVFNAANGDMIFIIAGAGAVTNDSLSRLRIHLAEKLNMIPQGQWKFLWVTEFPLFAWNEKEKRIDAMHHPFTSPRLEDIALLEKDPLQVKARLYDVVLNGQELASGSIRIHRREVQEKIFDIIGLDEAQAQERFGFLLQAFEYGAPPHGGIAAGIDRMVTAIVGEESIREVIAFPKTATGTDPLTGAPSEVDEEQLTELNIALRPQSTEQKS